MQYLLDELDIKTTYGLTVSLGAADLLTFPKLKDSLSHDFPEENGTDRDLAQPRFESRTFKLSCSLVADSRDDFKQKYWGLFTALKAPGFRRLYSDDIDHTYYIFYQEQQNIRKLSNRINANKVGLEFDLLFSETDPGDNIDDVYLVDEDGFDIIG